MHTLFFIIIKGLSGSIHLYKNTFLYFHVISINKTNFILQFYTIVFDSYLYMNSTNISFIEKFSATFNKLINNSKGKITNKYNVYEIKSKIIIQF